MNAKEIKILMLERGISVEALAAAIKENRASVSQTINYLRRHDRIRRKIETHLKKKVFDNSIQCGPANTPKLRSDESMRRTA